MALTRQEAAKAWWKNERHDFDVFISESVLDEIEKGDSGASARRILAVQGLAVLKITPDIQKLADTLIVKHALPAKAADDALHIAVAAYYRIDYVLTYNCKHIANATTFYRIREVMSRQVINVR